MEVNVDGFVLSCPTDVTEGGTLDCTLTNENEDAQDWPVVAILHRSSDTDRALVRGKPLDVEFSTLEPAATTDGAVWWQGDLLIAYSRFDWGGDAPAADETTDETGANSRTVAISVREDRFDEDRERFYVSLAPDRSKAVGIINANAVPVFIDDNDAPSSNAYLSGLRLKTHSSDLDIGFSRETEAYRTSVAYEVTEVMVAPTAAHDAASVVVEGEVVPSGQYSHAIKLGPGATQVDAVVTAQNGSTRSYSVEIVRPDRPAHVAVHNGDFTLECPSEAVEGTSLTCTLTNAGSTAGDWPVVGIFHSSQDENRALITEDLLIASTSPDYSQDLRLLDPQTPVVDDYNYGYGRLLSGGSWTKHTVYGYEKFDWSDSAAAGAHRSVVIEVLENAGSYVDDSSVELFYVALADDSYTGLADLVENSAPIAITQAPPAVIIEALSENVAEGADVEFAVTRMPIAEAELTVQVSVSESGAMVPSESEGTMTVTIPANDATGIVTLATTGDAEYEAHSTVTATVVEADGYSVSSAAGTVSTQVSDDDFPDGAISLDLSTTALDEGETLAITATVTTDRDEQPHTGVGVGTANVQVIDGTAESDRDFVVLDAELDFAASDFLRTDVDDDPATEDFRWRAAKTTTVTITDDAEYEESETFTVRLFRDALDPLPLAANVDITADSDRIVTINRSDGAEVLSAVMEVGADTVAGGQVIHGFSQWTSIGSMDVTDFEIEAKPNEVYYVAVFGSGSDRLLFLGLLYRLSADLILEIDGVEFATADAQYRVYGSHHYEWAAPDDFDWSVGDDVAVRVITLTPAPPPPDEATPGTSNVVDPGGLGQG